MTKTVAGRTNRLLWGALLLCTLYQCYRYPLKYNAASTSPTYSDTPLAFQTGKYVLGSIILSFGVFKLIRQIHPLKHWSLYSAVLFLFIFSVLKMVSGGNMSYFDPAFWMLFSLIVAGTAQPIARTEVDRFLRTLLIFSLAANLLEVLLFLFFGRLPALAYEGSFSVRFGSFLDDPNGFAALLFLLLGWSYRRFEGRKRTAVLAGLIISLLLTQSWTAFIFLFLIIVVVIIRTIPRRPIRVTLIVSATLLIVVTAAKHIPSSVVEGFQLLQQSKQESADAHMFPWTEVASRWRDWVVFGNFTYKPYESWWFGIMPNFGMIWWSLDVILVSVLVFSIWSSLQKSAPIDRPVYQGFLLFGYYFFLGSFNLAFSSDFPINTYFFLFSFLILLGKLEDAPLQPA